MNKLAYYKGYMSKEAGVLDFIKRLVGNKKTSKAVTQTALDASTHFMQPFTNTQKIIPKSKAGTKFTRALDRYGYPVKDMKWTNPPRYDLMRDIKNKSTFDERDHVKELAHLLAWMLT